MIVQLSVGPEDTMRIRFTKISDDVHGLAVFRRDGSHHEVELESKTFLRHDLAHLVVEVEVPILRGFWGLVAAGAHPLDVKPAGDDLALAESLAGPVQTLMRKSGDVSVYLAVLQQIVPDLASQGLADRLFERARRLTGHWRGTPYREAMEVTWHHDAE